MAALHITDIEAAINHWRNKKPAADGFSLPHELRGLAQLYALMVYSQHDWVDEFNLSQDVALALHDWYITTPHTPCIAICSTSQGDNVCQGCGRSFEEIQAWLSMSTGEKRAVWRRITQEGTAWRFNKYAERALEAGQSAQEAAERQPTLDL